MGYEWTEEEEPGGIRGGGCRRQGCGRRADGLYANQGRVAAGIVLYGIMWQGYPPDMSLAADAAADEAAAREDAELINLEESERMPAA
eukprot:6102781-Pleurochrysis_carterae.AAC.1